MASIMVTVAVAEDQLDKLWKLLNKKFPLCPTCQERYHKKSGHGH